MLSCLAATAVFIYFVMGAGSVNGLYKDYFDWPMCFCLASIVSATDPVAVVAALHELGAPEKLASIIDGESLLNDGSAMVMFTVFLNGLQGAEFVLLEAVALFIQ